jgi:hemolysin activation/secretion protein
LKRVLNSPLYLCGGMRVLTAPGGVKAVESSAARHAGGIAMRGSRAECVRAAHGETSGLDRRGRAARRALSAALALTLAALAPLQAIAQPAGVQPGVIEREYEDNAPPKASTNVSIPSVDKPRAWEDAQGVRFHLRGVEIDGNAAIEDPELMAPFADLVGREVSIGEVFAAADAITRIYDEQGYALSLAYVPAQDVKNGVVRVRVVEGYIAEVVIRDEQKTRSDRWDTYIDRLTAIRPLRSEDLERYLLLASDLAGVKIQNFFERMPNAGPGAMRLVMNVSRKEIGAHVEVNNRGSKAIGPIREFMNIELNGLLGEEERLSVFGVGAFERQRELAYIGARLDIPIGGEGTVVSFEAARSESDPGTDAISAIDYEGEGWTGSASVTHAFIRSLRENLYVTFGVFYKDLKSRILSAANSHDQITALGLSADYDSRDAWDGLWRAAATLFVGVDVFDSTKKNDPLASRAGASGQFVRLEGSISRLTPISPYASFYAELAGQVADGPLLVSEQCGYGGGHIGRAFDPFELTGDHCVKGRAELRFNIPIRSPALAAVLDSAQFYALGDFGVMFKAGTLLPGEDRVTTAESVGFGVRIRAAEYLSGFAEVVHPLGRGVAFQNGSQDSRFFFGVAADY